MIKANQYDIRKTTYNNGVSHKFDNRRITVVRDDKDGFYFQFKRISDNDEPFCGHLRLKNKVTVSELSLSREASEVILFSLAELMGYKIVEDEI